VIDLTGFLGAAYPWVKAAHVTFVIFWLAGLFLLPRFYVYHHETTIGSPEDRAWIERELPLPNLRFETFGNSGWFDAQEFVVRLPAQGIEVAVKADQTMLEALENAGADMMFDCRKGECGLCEVRVIELEGDIDHRDVFYSERQKDARSKLCCCVSRVVAGSGRALIEIQSS